MTNERARPLQQRDDGERPVAIARAHRHPIAHGRKFCPRAGLVTEAPGHLGHALGAIVNAIAPEVLAHHARRVEALSAVRLELLLEPLVPTQLSQIHDRASLA